MAALAARGASSIGLDPQSAPHGHLRRQFAALLDERNRLARQMHDTLIQGCVGLWTLLEAASRAQDVSPSLSCQLLDRARTEVRSAV